MWNDYSKAVDRNKTNVEETHINTRNNKRTYQPGFCSKPFRRRENLQCFSEGVNHEINLNKHVLAKPTDSEHTQNAIEKKYKCSECSFRTNNKTDIHRHLNMHKGIKLFQCNVCMKQFSRNGSFQNHIKNKHAENESTKDYQCSECSFETNYKHSFESHLNKHRGIKPFECNVCLRKFTEKSGLKMHIRDKHTETGSSKDYKCSECSYQTNYKQSFNNHIGIHTGIKQFECGICSGKFLTKKTLRAHIIYEHIKNERKKKYKCTECSYRTQHEEYLQMHLNKHRTNKPFECAICRIKFTTNFGLKMHIMNIHSNTNEKKHKCSECPYQTNFKWSLERHISKHKGTIKQFQCDVCMVKFTAKDNLKKHIKKKHAKVDSIEGYKCANKL